MKKQQNKDRKDKGVPLLLSIILIFGILGAVVLNEPVTGRKIAGIAVIIVGLVLINLPERRAE